VRKDKTSKKTSELAINRREFALATAGLAALGWGVGGGAAPASAVEPMSAPTRRITGATTRAELHDALDDFFDSDDAVAVLPPIDLPLAYERQLAHGTRKALVFEPGSKLVMETYTASVLTFYTDPLWIEPVTAIALADGVNLVDDPVRDPASPTTVTTLTLAGARTVAKGDRFRLISDDEVYEAQHGGFPVGHARRMRQGEVVTAGLDSTGTVITLSAPLKERVYATNVRLCALADARLDIIGGECTYPASARGVEGVHPMIKLEGLQGCRIVGFNSLGSIGAVFTLYGCIDTQFVAPSFHNGLNEPALNHFGYGIADTSGHGTSVTGVIGSNLRHAVDTLGYAQEADLTGRRVHRHGRTRNLTVMGGNVTSGCNTGLSSHDEADNIVFSGFAVTDNYPGARSGGSAYVIRGKNATLTASRSLNSRAGVAVSTFSRGVVSDCEILDCQQRALNFVPGDWTVPLETRGTIVRSTFSVLNANSPVWYVQPPKLGAPVSGELEDVVLAVRSTRQIAFTRVVQFDSPGVWRVRNLVIDLRELNPATFDGAASGLVGATSVIPFFFGVDGVSLHIDSCTILSGQNTIVRLMDGSPATLPGTSVTISRLHVEGDTRISASGGTSADNKFGINWSRFTSGQVFLSGRRMWGTGGALPRGRTNDETSALFSQFAAAGTAPSLQGIGDDEVTVRLGGTNGAVTMGNWPASAMRPGQRVTVYNESNGAVTFASPPRTVAQGQAATWILSDARVPLLVGTTGA
jgi:hypothetical protein